MRFREEQRREQMQEEIKEVVAKKTEEHQKV
jgi:hypothetical protein